MTVKLDPEARATLLGVARAALADAVAARPFVPPPGPFEGRLGEPGASFVTLHSDGALRGCIGSITPRRPLAEDVAEDARAPALEDRRFPPLAAAELDGLEIEISVLSPLEPLDAGSRAGLLAALRPGVDGLLIEEGAHRATFLPAVWRQLPEPELFLAHLERKAGLAALRFGAATRVSRYTVEELEGDYRAPDAGPTGRSRIG